jgi:hypothetical protein
MFELSSVTEEFETEEQCAHEVCKLLSVDGHSIPETFYRLYAAPLNINQLTLMNAVSYFTGAGFLKINCDCSPEMKTYCEIPDIEVNPHYEAGKNAMMSKSDNWVVTKSNIASLYLELIEC